MNDALLLPTPVNIGVASVFNSGTRELTVDVELYYTANGTGGNDYISVFLNESHIIGYQQDYVNGPQASYDHKDVMRGYITALWGDEVTTSTVGTTVMRTYTFTVPMDWNEANCEVVAVVGEYQGEIYQVRAVEAVGGTTTLVSEQPVAERDRAYPVPANDLLFLPLQADAAVTDLRITDGAGRDLPLGPWSRTTDGIAIDVSGFANGVYVYRSNSSVGTRTGRLMIQH